MTVYEIIETLNNFHAPMVLVGLSLVLVLIDYLFPTDVPCHFGYFCFAAAMFFVVPFPPLTSAVVALGVWVLLSMLHMTVFWRFLDNVPDDEEADTEEDGGDEDEPENGEG